MNAMQDSRRAALNIEEAALLPAMPRKRMAGSAALQSALRAAQAMDGKTTSNAVAVNGPVSAPPSDAAATSPVVPPASRAALHHVLQRRTAGQARSNNRNK